MENYNIWWSPIGLGTSLCSLPAKNLLIQIQLGWSLSDNLFSIRNDQETNEFAPFLTSTKTYISHLCSLLVDNGVLWKGGLMEVLSLERCIRWEGGLYLSWQPMKMNVDDNLQLRGSYIWLQSGSYGSATPWEMHQVPGWHFLSLFGCLVLGV